MTRETDVVFLLDVDNTLLDNDRVERDLRRLHPRLCDGQVICAAGDSDGAPRTGFFKHLR